MYGSLGCDIRRNKPESLPMVLVCSADSKHRFFTWTRLGPSLAVIEPQIRDHLYKMRAQATHWQLQSVLVSMQSDFVCGFVKRPV